MNLAARCTACGTVFRVVQDQLRVSDGWVRCGRCSEVFNAIENLVDVDADVAPAVSRPMSQHAPVDASAAAASMAPAPVVSVVDAAVAPDADANAVVSTAEHAVEPALPIVQAPDAQAAMLAEPPSRAAVAAPRFVRRADRAARWQRPRVRIALAATALLAGAALALQVGLAFRDTLVAHWPQLRPVLHAACDVAACDVGAARWIEALAVESSGLVRIEGTALYRLSLALKNRSAATVAMPALDVSLTDSQGGLMARRVIAVDEIGIQQRELAPLAELPLQATVAIASRPVAGYTIEIFYP